jgi:hypothetical protein
MVFSEISPLRKENGVPALYQQAKEWYGITLTEKDFTGCIRELHQQAHQQQKQLILRDWPLRCFEKASPDSPEPPGKLILPDYMPPEIPFNSFAFIRDTYDVFLSRPWGTGFLGRYLRYANSLIDSGMPCFRYEDFCREPENVMRAICDSIGLQFNADFVNGFSNQHKVTGDVSLGTLSRGQGTGGAIVSMPRRLPTIQQLIQVSTSKELRAANRLFGYPTRYFSRPIAWPWKS